MHIKRILIQGFKTYKNTTVIDALSPQFNVVVGRNGSGKSNFFSAIRFVLSDAYTHMSREERQGLIHEGSGTVMSAYVEIVFDNTDRRLPINKDEVSVRRTIGLKKDDYSLDGRNATRSDIMNLLESGGFSRSNPYYIVPQGKITSLTNSKDTERLALLKDVSGAKAFESRLKESRKEMTNSNLKRQRIDEALDSIQERLGDLQIESDDLKHYQGLDKSRKIYEYNLYDRELNDLNSEISTLEDKYNDSLQETQEELKNLESREKLCKSLSEEIDELKVNSKILGVEKAQDLDHYNNLLQVISSKELELNELSNEYNRSKLSKKEKINSIKKYQKLIEETKTKIREYRPKLFGLHQQETEIKTKLIELTTKQRALYSKQNRFSKFPNKAKRDEWIKKQIGQFTRDLNTKEVEISRLKDAITKKKEQIQELDVKVEEMTEIHNARKAQTQVKISHIKKEISELKHKINEVSDQRKSYWRDDIKLKSIKDSLTNDLTKANNVVSQTMDRQQSQGLETIEGLVKRLRLSDSVYGPLVSLFNVSDKYKTATEVIAGNSLFHIVVDTDETASILMEELLKTKGGRVTFIPLNRISATEIQYPDSNEYQCIPLIKKIKFTNPKISKAINHVFGRTIVVSELSKGHDLAKSFNLTAITLDGDKVDGRGALSGGFRDYKLSRLDAIKLQAKKKQDLQDNEILVQECNEAITRVNQEFTEYNNELQTKLKVLDEISVDNTNELDTIKNQLYNYQQELKSLETSYESVISIKQNLLTNIEQHKSEMASEFSQLNQQELQVLEDLRIEISKYEQESTKVLSENSDIETKLTTLESELIQYKHNIIKIDKVEEIEGDQVDDVKQEFERLNYQLQQAKARIDNTDSKVNELNERINSMQLELTKANKAQVELMKKIEKLSKIVEKSLNKKLILTSRRDELNRKLSDIGVLPEEAFDTTKFEGIDNGELLNKLSDINQQLTRYAHINKKAIEQYEVFTSQRNDLLERRQELDDSKSSIEQLIESLSVQKHDAINKSFTDVAQSFTKIFEQLVPSGTGKLVMTKENGSEDYTGVSISVSFNSKNDEQQLIEQLSGGQKSLCAITLILAIQNCDPAPFYLFDEIDANLDTQYRTAVASMINELSRKAQFICTTFRPEMLAVADKFHGVTFNNKVSTVSEISREEATTFVEGQGPDQ